MKEMISERLVLLAKAQECMIEVADMFDQWDRSQLFLEKNAFDSINCSDKVFNLSKEGNQLVDTLLNCSKDIITNPCAAEKQKMTAILENIQELFQKISDTTTTISETSHKIDAEVAYQREIEESVKSAFSLIGDSLDSAIACAEIMLTEL